MSRPQPLATPLRWLNHSLVRFMLVGGCGEVLYLVLFAAASQAGASNLLAITLAGSICLLINAVLHARISFRVRFHWQLLRDYLLVQALGLLLALGLGWLLGRLSAPPMLVGVATLVLWSGISFLLTRWRFQRSRP